MPELKTKKTQASAKTFIEKLPEKQRGDAEDIYAMMKKVTGQEGRMWGPSIVGFGEKVLTYANGKTLDWFAMGFSPRKAYLSVYLTDGFDSYRDQLEKIGDYKLGKSCLNVKKLSDIDETILKKILEKSLKKAKV